MLGGAEDSSKIRRTRKTVATLCVVSILVLLNTVAARSREYRAAKAEGERLSCYGLLAMHAAYHRELP